MWYKIMPTDVLVFKNSSSFNKGENVVAKTQFPPYPSVYTGALRTFYFAHHMELFKNAGTPQDVTANIKLAFSGLRINKKMYFPIPLDMVCSAEDEDEQKAYTLSCKKFNGISNYPLEYTLVNEVEKEVKNISQGILIERNELEKYLRGGEKLEICYTSINELITAEDKIGIGINKKAGCAQESLLYHLETIRPRTYQIKREKKLELIVEVNDLELPKEGLLKLGGEGKSAQIEEIENPLEGHLEIRLQKDIFKLYFATPTIFQQGYLPSWINKDTMIGEYKGIKVKLICAAIGRSESITGFDMKKKQPKPMYKTVPAGSVYYFKLLNIADKEQVVKIFHKRCITDIKVNEGFGYCLVGGV